MWIVLAFLAGVLLAIIVANLSSSSKKVERKIEHMYGVREPQFVRSMGSLLGPPIAAGNFWPRTTSVGSRGRGPTAFSCFR